MIGIENEKVLQNYRVKCKQRITARTASINQSFQSIILYLAAQRFEQFLRYFMPSWHSICFVTTQSYFLVSELQTKACCESCFHFYGGIILYEDTT